MNPDDFESFYCGSICPREISFPDGVKPRSYLQFAIDDFGSDSQRELINSASNAKKALHLQVESISDTLGFKAGKREKFPQRLEFCNACGVVGSRILIKLNHLRNAIEHDYIVPTKEQAEDFIDVVELFLAATNGLLRAFPTDLTLSRDDLPELPLATNYLKTEWEPSSGEIALQATLLTIPLDELHAQAKVEERRLISQKQRKKRDEVKRDAYLSVIRRNRKEVKRTVSLAEKDDYCAWAAFIIESSGHVF
jgi:hypothetical protein